MSFNSYGYNVYKKNQVNIGNPYAVQAPESQPVRHASERLRPAEAEPGSETPSAADLAEALLDKAREEAQFIRKEAEFEAQRLMDEAADQISVRTAEALQKAKEEGYRNGESMARQHYEELIVEAQTLRDQAAAEYDAMMGSLESDCMHMVLNIARKVIGDELRQNPDAILHLISDAVLACSNREHIVLKVSGDDFDWLVENEGRLRAMVPGLHEIAIRREASLPRGSCQVDTGFGIADGSAEGKLQMIETAFLELLAERTGSAEPSERMLGAFASVDAAGLRQDDETHYWKQIDGDDPDGGLR